METHKQIRGMFEAFVRREYGDKAVLTVEVRGSEEFYKNASIRAMYNSYIAGATDLIEYIISQKKVDPMEQQIEYHVGD